LACCQAEKGKKYQTSKGLHCACAKKKMRNWWNARSADYSGSSIPVNPSDASSPFFQSAENSSPQSSLSPRSMLASMSDRISRTLFSSPSSDALAADFSDTEFDSLHESDSNSLSRLSLESVSGRGVRSDDHLVKAIAPPEDRKVNLDEFVTERDLKDEAIEDIQGIPWTALQVPRESYRATRLYRYQDESQMFDLPPRPFPRNQTPSPYYTFKSSIRKASPSILHFQLRHLLSSTSNHDIFFVGKLCSSLKVGILILYCRI
jgi:hypothetical protein